MPAHKLKTTKACLLILILSFSFIILPLKAESQIDIDSPLSLSKRGDLNNCQRQYKAIEKLRNKRRKGGSAKQMDKWKAQLREKNSRFKQQRCQQWRNKLRA